MVTREELTSRVYHSMHTPVLLGGVPRVAAILNGTFTAVLFRATWAWEVLGVGLGLHALAYWLTTHDPLWVAVARRYWKTRRFYEVM